MLLFILYVFECPQNGPINRRVAYISYLDRWAIRYLWVSSVPYLVPSSFRKAVHQEVVIAYLGHLQQKGFNQITLWICPPTKGDDYIL